MAHSATEKTIGMSLAIISDMIMADGKVLVLERGKGTISDIPRSNICENCRLI